MEQHVSRTGIHVTNLFGMFSPVLDEELDKLERKNYKYTDFSCECYYVNSCAINLLGFLLGKIIEQKV